jgi:hypothetical protein
MGADGPLTSAHWGPDGPPNHPHWARVSAIGGPFTREWAPSGNPGYEILNYRPGINTCASTIHIIYANRNHYDALIFQGSRWENEQMTLSITGDRSTSAARPHIIQSTVDNDADETLLSTTRCSKRKIADSTQYSLPVGKRLHSQSIRTLPSAYNEQLTANELSKDKTLMNKRKREKCPHDKSKYRKFQGF